MYVCNGGQALVCSFGRESIIRITDRSRNLAFGFGYRPSQVNRGVLFGTHFLGVGDDHLSWGISG